jgi:2-polyprenyl-3-methyl-5-hydroxy-6-metoxy-1,4-benzoquinol methylase
MASLTDDRGYNQMFAPSKAMQIRSERRCDMIISEMSVTRDTTILEIGCGTGEIANFIAQKTEAQVLGTDICVPFIVEAKEKHRLPNLSFDVLNFNHPETLEGKKFDYIIGNGILHHLYYHLDEALENILFLLKDNGKLIFLEPNLVNPYCYLIFSYPYFRKKANLEPDEMAFTKGFIQKKLKKVGYSTSKVIYKDFLLPVVPDALINPVIVVGDIVEKIPLLNKMTQSIFIVGSK